MLPVALLAVDGAPLRGLERNFTFLPTVGAGGLVHLSGPSVITAPVSKTQFIHSFLSGTSRASVPILPVVSTDSLAALCALRQPRLLNGSMAGHGIHERGLGPRRCVGFRPTLILLPLHSTLGGHAWLTLALEMASPSLGLRVVPGARLPPLSPS